jgi:AAA15 family ATPase/GTPase
LQTGATHALQITATHKDAAGSPAFLDFIKHESAGTQRLAGLIGLILHALKTGGVFLVDELECSLHPLLIREILMLFKKRRHNPKGAQLIFTTHNTDILDDSILRLSEIALVRKNTANGTLVRRLVDAKKDGEDIRNVTNFRKQYLAGFYSGVPHPAL